VSALVDDRGCEAINAFLDENVAADPAQDVALALDSFSQAAMEAKYVILRRHWLTREA
jgi:hypothetical protein